MREMKLVSMFVLLALLLSAVPSVALAQQPPPPGDVPSLPGVADSSSLDGSPIKPNPSGPPQPDANDPGGGGGASKIWEQFAEEESGTTNQTFATSYYTSQYACDDNPDLDYVFVYYMDYQQNPNSIRFYSDDWWIRTVLPSSLKDFATWWGEVRLCIGPDRVDAVGGPGAIMSHVWLHQK